MQQKQQGGRSPFPASDTALIFTSTTVGATAQQQQQQLGAAEAASPISSQPLAVAHFEGGDDDLFGIGGDEDRGGGGGVSGSGNRWPRQETLALLKIRSDMDTTFRDATLKGPLWDDVSRHSFIGVANLIQVSSSLGIIPQTNAPPAVPIGVFAPAPAHVVMPASTIAPPFPTTCTLGGVNFSSKSTSSSSSSSSSLGSDQEEDDVMELEEEGPTPNTTTRKRKRASSSKHHRLSSSGNDKVMEFFEGLMKQVMQKQEAMQQRFLEAIEKREQDRMIREEAWKRQEMARLAREHELVSQERAISASRDAAIIAFLQKITGQTIQLPQAAVTHVPPAAPPPPPPRPSVHHVYQPLPPPSPSPSPSQPQPPPLSSQQPQQPQPYVPPQQQQHPTNSQQQQHLLSHPQSAQVLTASYRNQPPAAAAAITSSEIVVAIPEQEVAPAQQDTSCTTVGDGSFEATSSRWPKPEVLALIKLRSGLESRYQEAGPKGPLWEEISVGMHHMGYKRNAKRCKEKWENINKYFKKVKESNKKRSEDAKTCPYFHELDELYKKKRLGSGTITSLSVNHIRADQLQQQQQAQDASMIMVPKVQEQSHIPSSVVPSPQTAKAAASDLKDGSTTDLQTSNGGLTAILFGEGSGGPSRAAKKPADTVEEEQPQNHQRQLMMNEYGDIEEPDSDNIGDQEDDEYDDDDDLEDTKMAYRIQFQRQNTGSSNSNAGESGAPSFLAMVQ